MYSSLEPVLRVGQVWTYDWLSSDTDIKIKRDEADPDVHMDAES